MALLCIAIKDGEMLKFESLTEASKYFKVGIPAITLDIKLNRIRNGYSITSDNIDSGQQTTP